LEIAELIVRQFRNELAELSCVTARVVIVAACTFYVAAAVILGGFFQAFVRLRDGVSDITWFSSSFCESFETLTALTRSNEGWHVRGRRF
jgi:hypothetical protein